MKNAYYFLLCTHFAIYTTTLIFDPAGDTKHPGRLIGQTFERTAARDLTRKIKDYITTLDNKAIILFSRLPGEHKAPIEKIRFVQQCNPDLFIHIGLYQSNSIKPHIHLYFHEQKSILTRPADILTPLAHAHTLYSARTQIIVHTMYTSLQKETKRIFDVHAPIGIPSHALSGIPAPGIIIEIGIKDIHDLERCIAPLAASLLQACTTGES